MNQKIVGQNIKKIRAGLELSQSQVAEKAGISTVHVSHVETGNTVMSIDCLLNLCAALSTTPNDILMGEYDLTGSATGTMMQGIMDELNNKELRYQKDSIQFEMLVNEFKLKSNLYVGKQFLESNKKSADVVVLPSGLQYKIVTEGTGIMPMAVDTVEVHYKGVLIDGREFDSSYSRGRTSSFALNRVIRGWTEGFQHFKEGTKAILYIPSDLAYGDRQRGAFISPGSTLIFEVELFEVRKAASVE